MTKPKRVVPKKFLKQLASFSVALDKLPLNARRASVKWLWEACCSKRPDSFDEMLARASADADKLPAWKRAFIAQVDRT